MRFGLSVSPEVRAFAVSVELLACSVWVGGLVAIAVVARIARQQLDGAARIAFFRALGRRYLRVGGLALAVAYVDGAILLVGSHWSGTKSALVTCAGLLLAVTAVGVAQARSLTRLRAATLAGDSRLGPADINRRARRAGLLRGLIAILSVALVVLAAIAIG